MSQTEPTLTADEYRNRLEICCQQMIADHVNGGCVTEAYRQVRELAGSNIHTRELLLLSLREKIDAQKFWDSPDQQRRHAMLVALHDALVRDRVLLRVCDGEAVEDIDGQLLFDEAFYVDRYPEVAEAVAAGKLPGAFEHFISDGCREPRLPSVRPRKAAWLADGPVGDGGWQRQVATSNGGMFGRLSSLFQRPEPLLQPGFGINLIGYHSGNLGYAVSARHYYRYLVERGFEVCPIDLPLMGRSKHDTSYADRFLHLDSAAPYPVNLFVLNAVDLQNHIDARHPAIRLEGRVNVALPFWELPRLPEHWVEILSGMDVLIAASDFVKQGFMMDVQGPRIRELGHPIYLPTNVEVNRQRWDIPDEVTAFVCSFEMASDVNRKNPFAVIEAFEQALGNDERALLIVKVNNPALSDTFAPHLQRLKDTAARNRNVRILDRVLDYADVLSLFASADVFVSLHRAEGLGLCLKEAMTLGKPIIATGWSGNMAFCTEQNSCLVDYELVPVTNSTQVAYAPGMIRDDATWADAKVEDAAHWMRRLTDEPELRRTIGRRAAADMARYQQQLDARELMVTVQNFAKAKGIDLSTR